MLTSLILPSQVHLWIIHLLDFVSEEASLFTLLSPDEIERAKRLQSLLHKQRFIITRGMLRKTLSQYTGIAPQKIAFALGEYGKPHLINNRLDLHFNISHSADIAVFAISNQLEIGVDIEKIGPGFKNELAKRYFTKDEYAELTALPAAEQIKGFYQLWSKKEAVIKAMGHSLLSSLSRFSVSLALSDDIVRPLAEEQDYSIQSLQMPKGYAGALAAAGVIEKVLYKSQDR